LSTKSIDLEEFVDKFRKRLNRDHPDRPAHVLSRQALESYIVKGGDAMWYKARVNINSLRCDTPKQYTSITEINAVSIELGGLIRTISEPKTNPLNLQTSRASASSSARMQTYSLLI
jgi:hypothetical protein